MIKKLDVYLHQNLVGFFEQNKDGQLSFMYTKKWLDEKDAIALSQSLPLCNSVYTQKQCRAFFAGLLPEESNREIVAKILGVSQANDYALLDIIGGECAGAVTFLPHGEKLPDSEKNYKYLGEGELEKVLEELPARPLLAGEPGLRISLAGAQSKIAVYIDHEGKVSLPLGSAASSHIIKPAIPRFKYIVSNEAMCLELSEKVGIKSAKAQRKFAGQQEYLLVKRYDRASLEAKVRLHQEDFCQALGFPPERKYQSEEGPSLKNCFDLIREVSSFPAVDIQQLLHMVIFNMIVGNHDAHGKNFSLLYKNNHVRLAPAYDILSTVYYPELTPKMAMKFGEEYKSAFIGEKHIEIFSKECGLSKTQVKKRFNEVSVQVVNELKKLKEKYEEVKDLNLLINERALKFQSIS